MKVLVFAPPSHVPEGLDDNGYLEVPEGATVGYILRLMKMPKPIARFMLVSVNGTLATSATKLSEGDTVGFFRGLSGG